MIILTLLDKRDMADFLTAVSDSVSFVNLSLDSSFLRVSAEKNERGVTVNGRATMTVHSVAALIIIRCLEEKIPLSMKFPND